MYIPTTMKMNEQEDIAAFIRKNGFGLLVSTSLTASHLPFVLEQDEMQGNVLYSHMARANPHWREVEGQRVLVVFQGPHSYISPTWYSSKHAVPTWNYATVHCYGTLEVISADKLSIVMDKLLNTYEPALNEQSDLMPDDFFQSKLAGIVGFKVVIDTFQAKEKLGQHRSVDDQKGTFEALKNSDDPGAQALAQYMIKRRKGIGE